MDVVAITMRQTMLIYLKDASSLRNSYPAFCRPFALIGEGAALKFSDCAMQQFRLDLAATDGRATTTPNQVKALQHPIDPDQPPAPE